MAGKSADVIYIPAKRRHPIPAGQRAVVRVNAEAYNALVDICNALVDIYNESTLPMAQSRPCSFATRPSGCGW